MAWTLGDAWHGGPATANGYLSAATTLLRSHRANHRRDRANHVTIEFDPIQRESTLSDRVTRQIEGLILDGRLKPGDRLLSERALSQQFGVSRTVVREAIHSLVARGLLEVQSGSGTIVKSPSAESVTQTISRFMQIRSHQLDYKKVLEIRYPLEMTIAELAAKRILPEEIAKVDRLLNDYPHEDASLEELVSNDTSFHTALARATQNELFPLMLDSVIGFIGTMNEMSRDLLDPAPNFENYLAQHRAIFAEVVAGNATGARQAMHEHLLHAEEKMDRIMTVLEIQKKR